MLPLASRIAAKMPAPEAAYRQMTAAAVLNKYPAWRTQVLQALAGEIIPGANWDNVLTMWTLRPAFKDFDIDGCRKEIEEYHHLASEQGWKLLNKCGQIGTLTDFILALSECGFRNLCETICRQINDMPFFYSLTFPFKEPLVKRPHEEQEVQIVAVKVLAPTHSLEGKVKELEAEIAQLKKQKKEDEHKLDQLECVVCFDKPRMWLVLPCGHFGYCDDHVPAIEKTCYICQKVVKKHLQVFMS